MDCDDAGGCGPKGARIRAFTVTGEATLYREQQTYISDSDRVLGYTRIEGISDCQAYAARVTVTPSDDGGCHVGWSATIRAPGQRGCRRSATGQKRCFRPGLPLWRMFRGKTPRMPRLFLRRFRLKR